MSVALRVSVSMPAVWVSDARPAPLLDSVQTAPVVPVRAQLTAAELLVSMLDQYSM